MAGLTIAEQMRAWERDNQRAIHHDRQMAELERMINRDTAHRDDCMRWARRWRDETPSGARNNVLIAHGLNRLIVRNRRTLRRMRAERENGMV